MFLVEEDEGRELGRASAGHFWWRNVIGGVTDGVEGRRFEEGSGSREIGGEGRG